MNTNQVLKVEAAKQSTDTLLGALLLLDAKSSLTNEERMVQAATSEAISERHNLDALLETIFVEDLDFEGTYTDAIFEALARANA
jgi:hypothetical protein